MNLFEKAVFVTITSWSVSKSYTQFLLKSCDFQAYSFVGDIFVCIQYFSYQTIPNKNNFSRTILVTISPKLEVLITFSVKLGIWEGLVSSLHNKSIRTFLQTSFN